jgi:hypothetical protein
MTDASFIMTNGPFFFEAGDAALIRRFTNRPIDLDNGRKRADPESAKISFEFKSANF